MSLAMLEREAPCNRRMLICVAAAWCACLTVRCRLSACVCVSVCVEQVCVAALFRVRVTYRVRE